MRAAHVVTRLGRRLSTREQTRARTWIFPIASVVGVGIGANVVYGRSLSEIKDDIITCGEALVRGLRTLKAAVVITADYKLNIPNVPHDSEEYASALSACHRYLRAPKLINYQFQCILFFQKDSG